MFFCGHCISEGPAGARQLSKEDQTLGVCVGGGFQNRTTQDSRRHVKATRVITGTKGSGREGSLTRLGVGTLSERTQGMKEDMGKRLYVEEPQSLLRLWASPNSSGEPQKILDGDWQDLDQSFWFHGEYV